MTKSAAVLTLSALLWLGCGGQEADQHSREPFSATERAKPCKGVPVAPVDLLGVRADETGKVRFLYDATTTERPCHASFQANDDGAVEVSILAVNPDRTSADLRGWCVEAVIPKKLSDSEIRAVGGRGIPNAKELDDPDRGCVVVPVNSP